ncbi:MAG TPA: trypsin-like peptidase domain-containing protein [Povalibacter sp.]|uniref:trypsin-like peptidase domain-containing protein n=1 Tax=Povalibacter sp. TaxID=1962978 RepID=UPI002CC75B78|nr:trypsin-like peptidase domain-containing protein [Povalibacter sp.]HMN44514.1 trypsin-like peptidase domain-containing protein [Povalibacter sp.]
MLKALGAACLLIVSSHLLAQENAPLPPAALVPVAQAEDSRWTRTLERVATGVVTIQVDQTRAFDTEWNMSSQATGFVVDAKRGLILTNRHVVTPGPVTAQAVFLNREEVTLYPVYRDPVHDFGLYRYDPSRLRFIKPTELKLFPDGAQVGREIRVIGNDAGEQLSILAGTLARLDREAPNYGLGKYNDFNTFYYQAASSTSGGSSGSPVIDVEGRVVALNAGGSSQAASSFYLPLDRVERALKLIQDGKPVPRGTLETVFKYTPYDEVRRLGLRPATETDMRRKFPNNTGLLVVSEAQVGSAAEKVLEPGDLLIKVNDALVGGFDDLAEVLDSGVGKSVKLSIERGGQPLDQVMTIEDLHAITPDRYLEFGDAVVHTLSWQQARHINAPIRGVYVANPGYVLGAAAVPRGAVITEIGGKTVNALADFEAAVSPLKDGERVTVRFFTLDDPSTAQWRVIRMDRRWFPARSCHRDDAQGVWPCTTWPEDGVAQPPKPASTSFAKTSDPIVNRLAPSMVLVNFDMPYSVSGITERNYYGTGVIVDAARGLVVVDRNTVPVSIGDVRLTFAGTIEIPGRVEYVHPLHNLAMISYDPKLVGTTPVHSAVFKAVDVQPGEQVWAVGVRPDGKVQSRTATVASVDPVAFPLSRTFQFRETNLETIQLINGPADYDGVLANKQGEIVATWASFAYEAGREIAQENRGIPAEQILEMLPLVRGETMLHSLEAELIPVPLAGARKLGLSDGWVQRLEQHSPDRRQALSVSRLVGGSPASKLLRSGDLILDIDGAIVNRYREVERAVQKPQVKVTVLRDGVERVIDVPTVELGGRDLNRILLWAGAVLQEPHRALAAQRGITPDGVFVGYFSYGSPATRYQLWAGRRIVEVDGQPTPDLDSFIKAVAGRADRSSVRLRTMAWNGSVDVITLKLDNRYWPAYELKRTAAGWTRTPLE